MTRIDPVPIPPELLNAITSRIRAVCDDWPESDIARVARHIAQVKLKYGGVGGTPADSGTSTAELAPRDSP